MKKVLFTILLLFSFSCNNNVQPTVTTTTTETTKSQPKIIPPAPPNLEPKAPKQVTGNRTLEGLYESLKQKGWKLGELKDTIPLYDSEKTKMSSDENKRRYVFLLYENAEKAAASFDKVNEFYTNQRGYAVRSQNIIAVTFNPEISSLIPVSPLSAEELEKFKKDVEAY
ncbi:MAG: hypothetical protein RMM17_09660 [Acidobacteriota bacterium]|nr:hypothetical protein [Blastocatellia bacterium]MDW8412934.1 hypothetical protein [Acidobacteriota bacterium]